MSDYHRVHIPLLTVYFPGSFLLVSPSESYIPAVVWSNLAITTVGYGEITPRSFLGRLITIPILVFGLLLITLPSFVLGREFSLVWERMISKKVSSCCPLLFVRNANIPSARRRRRPIAFAFTSRLYASSASDFLKHNAFAFSERSGRFVEYETGPESDRVE